MIRVEGVDVNAPTKVVTAWVSSPLRSTMKSQGALRSRLELSTGQTCGGSIASKISWERGFMVYWGLLVVARSEFDQEGLIFALSRSFQAFDSQDLSTTFCSLAGYIIAEDTLRANGSFVRNHQARSSSLKPVKAKG